MKRLPLLVSFLAVVLLSVSLAYWAMQLFKAPQRPLAAPPQPAAAEPSLEAAASLFGGQPVTVAVSNYQLRGVVAPVDGKGGVAILAQEGKPTQSLKIGGEVAPGVKVKEVQAGFVLLDEGGVAKRVDLMVEAAKPSGSEGSGIMRTPIPLPSQGPVMPPQVTPPLGMAVPLQTASMAPGMTAGVPPALTPQDIQLQQLQQQQQQLLIQQQMLQQQLQQMPAGAPALPPSRSGATMVSPPQQQR